MVFVSIRFARRGSAISTSFLQNGWTPLHVAAYEGHATVVQALLEDPRVSPVARNKVGSAQGDLWMQGHCERDSWECKAESMAVGRRFKKA